MPSGYVEVTDPYFGRYYKILLIPSLTVFVGPCAQIRLRFGKIWNTGPVARQAGTAEKECDHVSVVGSVVGSPPPTSLTVLPMGDANTEKVVPLGSSIQRTVWSQTLTTGTSGAVLVCDATRTLEYKGVAYSTKTAGAEILFEVSRDAYTGTTTYEYKAVLRTWGNWRVNPVSVSASNPYGVSEATPGLTCHDARYWIGETLREAGTVCTDYDSRSQAFYNAIDALSLADVNWLESAAELREPLDSIRKLTEAARSPGWRGYAKTLASLHLFWKYCVKTSVLDAQEVVKLAAFLRHGVRRAWNPFQVCMIGRGSATHSRSCATYTETQEYHAKVAYGAGWGPFSTLAQLQLLGLAPMVNELWDIIPFSFVVDWLIPVGRILQNLGDLSASIQLPLKYVVWSRKTTRVFHRIWVSGGHTFTVSLTATYYHRWVRGSLPYLTAGVVSFRDPRKQFITAAALAAQYIL